MSNTFEGKSAETYRGRDGMTASRAPSPYVWPRRDLPHPMLMVRSKLSLLHQMALREMRCRTAKLQYAEHDLRDSIRRCVAEVAESPCGRDACSVSWVREQAYKWISQGILHWRRRVSELSYQTGHFIERNHQYVLIWGCLA